jgi:pimeloyl-ACP methyl ester carboxylesterase
MPHVIVLLPGILGSTLRRGEHQVYDLSVRCLLHAAVTKLRSLTDLALPEDRKSDEGVAGDIEPSGLLRDLTIVPGFKKIDGYSVICKRIQEEFDVTPGENYFEFAYDWRLDNRLAAGRLEALTCGWLEQFRRKEKRAKLILIAHSMGGLVARYFLEVREGWKQTHALITIGTPYRGSLNALNYLVNGSLRPLRPVLNLSTLLRSFTSVYQLLPIYPCYDGGNGQMVRACEAVGIPHVVPERVKAAFAFHEEIRLAVERHMGDRAYQEGRYQIHPVVGAYQPTWQAARLRGKRLEVLYHYEDKDYGGDGTVPRVSATPLELGDNPQAMYSSGCHARFQNESGVLDHVMAVLRGFDMPLGKFRGAAHGEPLQLGLLVKDAYDPDEPVLVRVRPQPQAGAGARLFVDLTTSDGAKVVGQERLVPTKDGWWEANFGVRSPGGYRVTASGDSVAIPVTDVTAVCSGI